MVLAILKDNGGVSNLFFDELLNAFKCSPNNDTLLLIRISAEAGFVGKCLYE